MVISSTTAEGQPNRCPACRSEVPIELSDATVDAPCARCGHLMWFTWENLGDVDVIKPTANVLTSEALDAFLDSVAIRPGIQLVLDLAEVNYFASAALARLVALKKRVIGVGGIFTIRHVNPELMAIFRTTRLDHVFNIEP